MTPGARMLMTMLISALTNDDLRKLGEKQREAAPEMSDMREACRA